MGLRSTALIHLAWMHSPRSLPLRSRPFRAPGPSRWTAATATYIICTTPRSGSWLLSEGLASTSLAGKPREWFNALEERQYSARWRMEHSTSLRYSTYLRLANAESTTSNGVSGVKLHYYQFAELPKKMEGIEGFRALGPAQTMRRLFPNARYIWLTRRDKVRQAISFLLAAGTDEWWRIEGTADKPLEASDSPEFDGQRIARMVRALEENDARWRSYFEESRIAPLVIQYEDLAADYACTIASVLGWLGIPEANRVVVPPPRLLRQSNARNEEWVGRYAAYQGTRGATEADPQWEIAQRALARIPDAWKQWIAQHKLLDTKNEEIVEVLTSNGYNRISALDAVEKADADPYLRGVRATQRRLQKAVSILDALVRSAHLDSGLRTIERRLNVSRDEFRDRYYAPNRPVILTGLMTDWPAMTAWRPEYLKRIAGERIVEVMTGREADPHYETNGRKHRTELRFADYIDMVYSGKVTNDYHMVANNGFFQTLGMEALLADFTPFPEYLQPAPDGRQCFFWFGPAGTITPLHHDTSNILIAQVAGRKRYRLIPSTEWQYVYNREGVFSDVDCDKPDLKLFPKFRHATVIDIVVEPGEVLFMPVGWWHHVRALEVSMTVSFTNFVFPNYFTWG